MTHVSDDEWSRWLLGTRFGHSSALERLVQRDVQRFRDRVLDAAQLGPCMTFADIGTGDGLLALGAIDRIGPSLNVILTDISQPLLNAAEQNARARSVLSQCRFICTSAESLAAIPDASVDAAGMRAVLAYVPDKRAAFRELFRILKSSGRISLAEPIMQDEAFEACALTKLIASQPQTGDIDFLRLLQRWKAAQYPSTEEQIWKTPTTNFSERDLFRMARETGFADIHVELHLDYRSSSSPNSPAIPADWETFLNISPHPHAPPLKQILAEQFTAQERHIFELVLRPSIESKEWRHSDTICYLTAKKP